MFISCACGEKIHDNTDLMSWKARILPDQQWEEFFDLLETLATTPDKIQCIDKISGLFRGAWECVACGRLYIENRERELMCYTPQELGPPKYVLRGKEPLQKKAVFLESKPWWKLW